MRRSLEFYIMCMVTVGRHRKFVHIIDNFFFLHIATYTSIYILFYIYVCMYKNNRYLHNLTFCTHTFILYYIFYACCCRRHTIRHARAAATPDIYEFTYIRIHMQHIYTKSSEHIQRKLT